MSLAIAGKPKSAGPAAEPSSESEVQTSDDESTDPDSDADEEAPMAAARPSDPLQAVAWDTSKALWRSSRRGLTGDDIKAALGQYWLLLKAIRDRWTELEKAETEKGAETARLKGQISDQRDLINASLRAALATGHKDIVER